MNNLQNRKLYRTQEDKIIGGVCGGLGRYLNIDSNLIRILTVIITLLTFTAALIAYIVACIIIPSNEPTFRQ